MKVIFMGTSSFALPSLKALVKSDCEIVAVYTQPPRRAGRGKKVRMSEVGLFAQENNIKLLYPENFSNPSHLNTLKNFQPDFVLVVAYGLILSDEVLSLSKIGFFNVHASILPRWRGAAPIQRALLANDNLIGVSIIKLATNLDAGPIVLKKHLKIEATDNLGSLYEKLSLIGADLTSQLYNNIHNLNFVIQDSQAVTYARKIEKFETQIEWDAEADEVDRQIRAFAPKPGAWFDLRGERIKILKCRISNGVGEPGYVLDECFQIACKKGSIFPVILQRSGKSPLTTEEFLRGYKAPVGVTLKKINF